MKNIVLIILFAFFATTTYATEYFVDLSGGDLTECNGLTADAWDEVDDDVVDDCALIHPWLVHGPSGGTDIGFSGGDIMTIDSDDSFEMGYDAGYNVGTCSQGESYKCYMEALPSGSEGSPTIIRGDTWDSGCASPPELWGSSAADYMIYVNGTDWFELRCLELTDHDSCVENWTSCGNDRCSRDWSGGGLTYAENGIKGAGSDNVVLENLNIHGLTRGLQFGNVSNVTTTNVTIRGNAIAGWDFHEGSTPSASGDMVFDNVTVTYNGCHEDYPIVSGLEIENCFGQDIPNCGYGDGLGTDDTAGDWVITDSNFSHNTSDGLDLLYLTGTGSLSIKRSWFEGNAGAGVKVSSDAVLEDNVIIGNCTYHETQGLVQATWGDAQTCRADSALGLVFSKAGQTMDIISNTIIGENDIVIVSNERGAYTCDGSEVITMKNNIIIGSDDMQNGGEDNDQSAMYYDDCAGGDPTMDYGSNNSNITYHTKNSPCTDAGFICPDADPEINIDFSGGDGGRGTITCTDPHNCDPTITDGDSPLVGAGEVVAGYDSLDQTGDDRGAVWDIGALELSAEEPDCDDSCELCATEEACDGSALTCYWYDSACNDTAQYSCDSDHCDLCTTIGDCLGVSGNYCKWNGTSCYASTVHGISGCSMRGVTIR